MVERFTLVQMKELLDIYTIIKIFTDRIENLESKITNMPKVIKYLTGELKALEESIKFQNETYKKIKKDMTEEKQKLKTHSMNNNEVQNFIQKNTEIKEQIADLEKVLNSRVTKSSYETKLHKMTSHFELVIRKFL